MKLPGTCNPLQWRECPVCRISWIDAEISEQIARFCEPGAFHSRLLGGRNEETGEIELWKCPDCGEVFPVSDRPVIHSLSDKFLPGKK